MLRSILAIISLLGFVAHAESNANSQTNITSTKLMGKWLYTHHQCANDPNPRHPMEQFGLTEHLVEFEDHSTYDEFEFEQGNEVCRQWILGYFEVNKNILTHEFLKVDDDGLEERCGIRSEIPLNQTIQSKFEIINNNLRVFYTSDNDDGYPCGKVGVEYYWNYRKVSN